jgi:uncharacterized membrane protein YsdA (DUF1294 family)
MRRNYCGIYRVCTKELYTLEMIENKYGVLRTSHLHQSIEKTLKVLFQMTWVVVVVARLR